MPVTDSKLLTHCGSVYDSNNVLGHSENFRKVSFWAAGFLVLLILPESTGEITLGVLLLTTALGAIGLKAG